MEKQINAFFSQCSFFSEASIVRLLAASMTAKEILFLSNSMPIRHADHFFFPSQSPTVFANRGLSGIDGNIATAAGIARGEKKPTVALLGDLATLHDLNSLALVASSPFPLILIILNNGGGDIFSYLPLAKRISEELLDRYFSLNHLWTFSQAAALFGIPYFSLSEKEPFQLPSHSCIIEISTQAKKQTQLYDELASHLQSVAAQEEHIVCLRP
jgi:2-succinyl-5-enolpyruvyl-6-hydroxy-3-cyclohexene-1-carboxylate synthase